MTQHRALRLGVVALALLLFATLQACSWGAGARAPAAPQAAPTAGAPADADNDGVADPEDECPATAANTAVDAFGCPVPLFVTLNVPHGRQAPADPDAFRRQLADIARIMRQNPAARLRIEGHSVPGEGPYSAQAHSQIWAQQAAASLTRSHGIAPSRIKAVGMGAAMPLVSNATQKGRSRNRRLELTLQGHYASRDTASGPLAAAAQPAAAQQEPLPQHRMQPEPPALPAPLHLRFAYGGTDLVPQDNDNLQRLGSYLQQHPEARVHLVGHTDAKGSEAFNLRLSRQRAAQVREMLVARYNIAPSRISTEGKGESAPIASNTTEAGRLANRRVSISLRSGDALQQIPETAAIPQDASVRTASREIPRVQPAQLAPGKQYQVTISITQCKLWLYEKDANGGLTLVRTYDVATPRPGTPGPEGLGYVTRIDFNPWWVPTENLKRAALNKGRRLPDRVRPGSSANPMGKFKIHLSHGTALRIHGTNQPNLIGRRVSSGCIRMTNEQGLEMARAINEGTEVLVVD